MGQGFDMEYKPQANVVPIYRYERYKALGRVLEKQSSSIHATVSAI